MTTSALQRAVPVCALAISVRSAEHLGSLAVTFDGPVFIPVEIELRAACRCRGKLFEGVDDFDIA